MAGNRCLALSQPPELREADRTRRVVSRGRRIQDCHGSCSASLCPQKNKTSPLIPYLRTSPSKWSILRSILTTITFREHTHLGFLAPHVPNNNIGRVPLPCQFICNHRARHLPTVCSVVYSNLEIHCNRHCYPFLECHGTGANNTGCCRLLVFSSNKTEERWHHNGP